MSSKAWSGHYRNVTGLCATLLLAALTTLPVAAAERATSAAGNAWTAAVPALSERLLASRVNGVEDQRALIALQTGAGSLLVTREAVTAWGLFIPGDVKAIQHHQQYYYPLDDVPGLEYTIDEARQILIVEAGASSFNRTLIDGRPDTFHAPQTGTPGGFFNYDVLYESSDPGGDIATGAFELGAFNRWGVGTTTFLAQGLEIEEQLVRLNSTWRYDWPAELRTLSLGDTFSRTGTWGRAVLFGGFQWGTNFGTQPDFITFPLPQFIGETALPASIEVYANDLRQLQEQVQPGPFTIRDIPVVTGANELQIVVRDVLGRKQVISQPFYVDLDLLNDGLHDYTYEAGVIRENFSLESNDYGRAFFAGMHRLGLTDRLTGEARLEVLRDQQAAGVSATASAAPWLGTVNGSVAGSHADAGEGALGAIGVNRQGRRFDYGLQTTWTTKDFRQLGRFPGEPAPRQTTLISAGMRLFARSSISVSHVEVESRARDDIRFINASYSMSLFRGAALNVFASRDLDLRDTFIGMTLSTALASRTSASVSHMRDHSSHDNQIQIQRNLPRGTGFGYRLLAEDAHGAPDARQAEVAASTEYGVYRAETARLGNTTGYRLNAAGGGAVLGGNVFLSRRVDDSFGVVQVGDYENVRVYHENQEIARTNRNGAVFIPDMRSFDENQIRIEQADLPLDAQIEGLGSTAVPGFRQGALVSFDVHAANAALIEILQENGEPVPAGAAVGIIGAEERFPVARRGEAWVTGLARENQLVANWNGRYCTFEVTLPENAGPLPRVGPVICLEVTQ